jgi:hypothetical protein
MDVGGYGSTYIHSAKLLFGATSLDIPLLFV